MKRKLLSILLVASMSVGMLAGCGDSSSKTSGVAKTQTTDDKSESKSNDSSSEDREVDSENIDTDDDLVCYTSGVDIAKYEKVFESEEFFSNFKFNYSYGCDSFGYYIISDSPAEFTESDGRMIARGGVPYLCFNDGYHSASSLSVYSTPTTFSKVGDVKDYFKKFQDLLAEGNINIDIHLEDDTGHNLTPEFVEGITGIILDDYKSVEIGNYLMWYELNNNGCAALIGIKGTGYLMSADFEFKESNLDEDTLLSIVEACVATTTIQEPLGLSHDSKDLQGALIDMTDVDCEKILNDAGWTNKTTLDYTEGGAELSIGLTYPSDKWTDSSSGLTSVSRDWCVGDNDVELIGFSKPSKSPDLIEIDSVYDDVYVSSIEDVEYVDGSGSYKRKFDEYLGSPYILTSVDDTDDFIACTVRSAIDTYIYLYIKNTGLVAIIRYQHEFTFPSNSVINAFVHTLRVLNTGGSQSSVDSN